MRLVTTYKLRCAYIYSRILGYHQNLITDHHFQIQLAVLKYQPFFRQNCITATSIWTRQLLGYFHWNKTFSSLILKDSCTLYIQYTQIQSYPMYPSQSPVLYIRLYLYIYMDIYIYVHYYIILYTYPGVCGFVEGNPLVDNFPYEQVTKQHDWWTNV